MQEFARFGSFTPTEDFCLKAEFGYYNRNAGVGNAEEQLVKAWRVTPKEHDYPYAFYNDHDGTLLSYDDGIRTIR
ncbi:hypothetical protein GCM10027275_38230 [Rhabdobacter roseus]